MSATEIPCPHCKTKSLSLPTSGEGEMRCPCAKNRRVLFHRFPAYERVVSLPAAAQWVEGESTCFHHHDRAAVAVCADCGVFICGLCQVKVDNASTCLNCFAARQAAEFKSDTGARGARRMVYDNLALAMAVVPTLFFWPTLITAPITLYLVIRYWNKHPCSIIPRTRIRFVFAAIIAVLQIVGWVFFSFGIREAIREGLL